MDQSFAQVLQAWQPFNAALMGAAAALLGLLFVAVSLRPTLFATADHRDLLAIAVTTLGGFLFLLFIGYVCLIPDQDPEDVGWPLLLMGVSGAWPTLRQLRTETELIRHRWGTGFFVYRIVLPNLCYVGLIVLGVALLLGNIGSFRWLSAIDALLLLTSVLNTWDLLIRPTATDAPNPGQDQSPP